LSVARGDSRLAGLDVLRAVAVLLVIGRHLPLAPGEGGLWLALWQQGGWIGVDLFFVLSGFLVSGLLFAEYRKRGAIQPVRFLIRRGFKIYPAYFALLLAMLAVSLSRGNFPGWDALCAQVFFLQNYWKLWLHHTWSLAVEEHFYLALPFLLLALGQKHAAVAVHEPARRPFAALPWFCLAVMGGCLAWRLAMPWSGRMSYAAQFFPTHLRCDGLFLGVALSWWQHFRGEELAAFVQRWRWGFAVLATGLAAPPFFLQLETTRWLSSAGFTMLSLSAALWLLLAVHSELRRGLLARIGFYSYSIYLWHYPISTIGMDNLPLNGPTWVRLVVYVGLCLGIGIGAARLVELPFLRLRDRLFPSRSA
jgi:peptidoglycan/LPS O-acetylase OafA/YrhL